MKNERIDTIPNAITFSRIIFSVIIAIVALMGGKISTLIVLFIIGALTDYFDGYFARKLHKQTKFGGKFDLITDKFFISLVVFATIYRLYVDNLLTSFRITMLLLVITRELLALPFALYATIKGIPVPVAKKLAKFTTVMQGITFPLLLLNIYYGIADFVVYLVIATSLFGLNSVRLYVKDTKIFERK